MNPVTDAAALVASAAALRKGAAQYATNLFADAATVERWQGRYEVSSLALGGSLFVLRKDRDFYHLHFATADQGALGAELAELCRALPATMTADLVGRPEDVAALGAVFAEAGFGTRIELQRMARPVKQPDALAAQDPAVVIAAAGDARAIAELLDASLDRYSEQIPTLAEIQEAVGLEQILLVKDGSQIAGLLYYETTGQASLLRHWFVDARYREQRIGARLIHDYFARCPAVTRYLLWVITTNENAIKRYQHYGYVCDRLLDRVVIREGQAA